MINEITIPVKGVKKKIIYHFSDSHLTERDGLSTAAERERAEKAAEAWEKVRADFARTYGEPYGEFQRISPGEHFRRMLAEAARGDALVLAGDILDYVSPANLRFTDECLAGFEKPFIAVCGNHEHAGEIPEGRALSGMKKAVQALDMGDLQIVGVDNSRRAVTKEQNEELKKLLETGKPAVIVLHVPIMCEENAAALEKSGVYFQFNYDGCPEENVEMIELIKAHGKNVCAVLAGHLHYANVSALTPGIPQIVTSQGIVGNMNKYYIGE